MYNVQCMSSIKDMYMYVQQNIHVTFLIYIKWTDPYHSKINMLTYLHVNVHFHKRNYIHCQH